MRRVRVGQRRAGVRRAPVQVGRPHRHGRRRVRRHEPLLSHGALRCAATRARARASAALSRRVLSRSLPGGRAERLEGRFRRHDESGSGQSASALSRARRSALTGLLRRQAVLKPTTAVLWLESPTNPLLKVLVLCVTCPAIALSLSLTPPACNQISDISALSKLAKSINPSIIVVVDNTFLSPYVQRPLSVSCHRRTRSMSASSDSDRRLAGR